MWVNLLTENELQQIPEPNQTELRRLCCKYNRSMAITWGILLFTALMLIVRDQGWTTALLIGLCFPVGIIIGLIYRKHKNN